MSSDEKCKVYTEEQTTRIITEAIAFSEHVKRVTQKYIGSLNLPIDGKLSEYNFDLEHKMYTVTYTFQYGSDNDSKSSFYVIPLNLLWDVCEFNNNEK